MLQHLLRRLVFDVPILNEYAKMPLKVCLLFKFIVFVLFYFIPMDDYIEQNLRNTKKCNIHTHTIYPVCV